MHSHTSLRAVISAMTWLWLVVLGDILPSAAFADVWSWQNPLPQGNNVTSISCPAANVCKAVGDGGLLLSWDGSAWSIEATPTTAALRGVSCSSTTACKAVGDGGTIISWDGSAWTADTNADATTLTAVSCPSANLCKAVGSAGTIRSWNGTAWSGEASGTTDPLTGVSCPTTGMCKAVGHDGIFVDSGFALAWNGATWGADAAPDVNQLYSVSCASDSSCKAVGLFGDIVSWNGSAWTDDNESSSTLLAVSCASPSMCMAISDNGQTRTWNGTTWGFGTSLGGTRFNGISCPSATSCKAVGVVGTVISWDGSTWTRQLPFGDNFRIGATAIACPQTGACKTLLSSGSVLAWNGLGWTTERSAPGGVLMSDISCPTAGFCKAVGFNGVIISWNGSVWSNDVSGTAFNINGVDCTSATFCKAVGDSGTLLTWDGNGWASETGGASSQFLDVDCASPSLCKAVGNQGVIRSWNGSAWSVETSGTTSILNGVSCPAANLCKTADSGGAVRTWSGSTWSVEVPSAGAGLEDIDCPTVARCKAVGDGGTIVGWDGSTWTADTSPNRFALYGVSCTAGSQQCITAGASTVILGTNVAPAPPTATPTETPTPTDTPVDPTATPTASQGGANLVVNSAADTNDGACDLLGSGTGNQDCTLREAMVAADAIAGHNTIAFAIPGGPGCSAPNVCTILLGSTLSINGLFRNGDTNLTIDGAPNGAKITIDGGNGKLGGVRILDVFASNLTVNALNFVDANGGAIFTGFAPLWVQNCTFKNNYLNGCGPAIRAENRDITVINSTFVGNEGTNGGGICNGGASFTYSTIVNSTFVDNVASFGANYPTAFLIGTNGFNSNQIVLQNNVFLKLDGSANVNCRREGGGGFTSDAFNVSDDGSCGGATVQTRAAINLSALADNGGPTLTMAPATGSALHDAGDPSVCEGSLVNNLDQRGFIRPAGAACDVGSVEVGGAVPPTATPTNVPSATPTETATDTPTNSPTASPTSSPTETATATPTASPTSSPTMTATQTPTNSPSATLTPVDLLADDDQDGVPDATESGAPGGGDGNDDGTPDGSQAHVASVPAATGAGYITLVASAGQGDGCGDLRSVSAVTEAIGGGDDAFDYPFGLVRFALQDCRAVTITVYFHGDGGRSVSRAYRKFGPVAPDFAAPPMFYTLPGVEFGAVRIPADTGPVVTTATFTLVDNQLGDASGVPNVIVDPGGLAALQAQAAPAAYGWGILGLIAALTAFAAFRLEVRPQSGIDSRE